MPLSVDIRRSRWDAMREGLVAPAAGGEVVVTLDALRAIAGWHVEPDEAVGEAIEHGALIRQIANAVPMIDGVATVTARIVDGRDWSVQPYDASTEDAYEVVLNGRADR